jgi:hypothetical protein
LISINSKLESGFGPPFRIKNTTQYGIFALRRRGRRLVAAAVPTTAAIATTAAVGGRATVGPRRGITATPTGVAATTIVGAGSAAARSAAQFLHQKVKTKRP